MRYYIYISDQKVDMLLPQVPAQTKKRCAAEFAIDFKIFSIRRQIETLDNDTRVSRLQAVERDLRDNAEIGTITDPGAHWIAGQLPMHWGICEVQYFSQTAKLACFVGQKDSSYIVLCGSAQNVLGTTFPSQISGFSGSLAPSILAVLAREAEWIRTATNTRGIDGVIGAMNLLQFGVAEGEALEHLADLVEMQAGAVQEVEFLAKRLMSGRTIRHTYGASREVPVILGTPLFVSQAD